MKLAAILFAALLANAAPMHGDGHRPDDNEARHRCHHRLVYCAQKCHEAHEKRQPDLDKCLNFCLGQWGKCVEDAEK